MKNYALLFLFFLLPIILIGQNTSFNLKWGNKNFIDYDWGGNNIMKPIQWTESTTIVGAEKSGFYVLHPRFNTFTLERYDSNFNLKNNILYLLPEIKFRKVSSQDLVLANDKLLTFNASKILYFNKKLLLFAFLYDIKSNEHLFFVQNINKQTLERTGSAKSLGKTGNAFTDRNFDYSISKDSSKLLITSQKPLDRTGKEQFSLRVCDADLNLMWERDVALPYNSRLVIIRNTKVDEKGNAYVLAKIYKNKLREKYKGFPNYEYKVFVFKKNGYEYDEYSLKSEGNFINDLDLKINDKGEAIGAGLFSKKNSYRIKGTCYFRINIEKQKIVSRKFEEFEKDFLKGFMQEKRATKGKELYNYSLDHLVLRSDGGVVLLAEKKYLNQTHSGTYYHYHDIFAINLNPSGRIDWATKIPKRQVDKVGFFSSYNMSVFQNKVYLFFNDHSKNLNRATLKKAKKYHYTSYQGATTVTILNTDGSLERKQLYQIKKVGIIPALMVSKQVDKNTVLLYGENEKETVFRLGKLSFE